MLTQEKIDQLALQIGGELAVEIVRFLLENGENISEFLIAEKLGISINQIRKTMYLLQENNLVSSMRKKDKKKGWYIYYWTFSNIQAHTLITRMKQERISNLKKRLELETMTNYFTCKKGCIRMAFERALENNFTCTECNSILKEVDNSKRIKIIKEELGLLEAPEKVIEEPEKAEAAA
ncbi:hypothetical protein K8R33_03120 [archaeon]|nr:hypothetical protein [archaeon]